MMFLFQVALGRVLKAVVTFKGILIEWVVVRAHNESLLDEDGKVRQRCLGSLAWGGGLSVYFLEK